MNRRDVLKAIAAVLTLPLARLMPTKRPTVYTWRGVNGRFDDPDNWTPRGVPGKGDDAVIHSGTLEFDGCAGPLHGVTITGGTVCVGRTKDGPMLCGWDHSAMSINEFRRLEA
jgi:hypothetical protein